MPWFFDRFVAIRRPLFRCECGSLVTKKNEYEHVGGAHRMRITGKGTFIEWIMLKTGVL